MKSSMYFEIKVKILNANNSCSFFQTKQIGFGLTRRQCQDSALGSLLWALRGSFVEIVEVNEIKE